MNGKKSMIDYASSTNLDFNRGSNADIKLSPTRLMTASTPVYAEMTVHYNCEGCVMCIMKGIEHVTDDEAFLYSI